MHGVGAAHGLRVALTIGPYVSAVIVLAGVKLHMDWERETYYLEVFPVHSRKALRAAICTLEACGLEIMDEDECPSEVTAAGTVRTWLAEVPEKVAFASVWDEIAPGWADVPDGSFA